MFAILNMRQENLARIYGDFTSCELREENSSERAALYLRSSTSRNSIYKQKIREFGVLHLIAEAAANKGSCLVAGPIGPKYRGLIAVRA
jgi:hypothetical protein